MTIEQTIQKAIEGGYILITEPFSVSGGGGEGMFIKYHFGSLPINRQIHFFLLDPQFWQCLGNAMGWENYYFGWFVKVEHGGIYTWVKKNDPNFFWGGSPNETPNIILVKEGWQYHWHSFIYHLAEGKSIESFFEKL